MGRKQANKKIKKNQQSSEEQISSQEFNEDDEKQFDDADLEGEFGEDTDGDSILLQKIQERILQSNDDQEKLSWAAIYQIKKQEAQINDQMQKEIDEVREKYQNKRLPLMTQIAEAVAGKKLDKSIYTDNEFIKSINLNKTKPKALKDYWGKVFDSCGLIASEDDIELLQSLTSFKCQLIDAKLHHIKLTFEFQNNQYLGNKLEVQVSGSVNDGNFVKKLDYQRKGEQIDENSLFGLLTGKDSDDQQVLDTCQDLYRAYVSSTYFYFYEPTDDLDPDQEGDGEGDQDQDEDEDDDQEDSQQKKNDIKAVKKEKGSAITEKPECKQQ